jgi:hypothetical protein
MERRLCLTVIDHLVYSTIDLEETIRDLETRLGVRATLGGRHPARGTCNALMALSDSSYLELVGPDPTQAHSTVPRWFGIDGLEAPRLVTWAVKHAELDTLAAWAMAQGVLLGPVVSGSRQGADGAHVRWRFTDPATVVADGLVPFFIDWGDSPHPAASAPRGPALVSLRAEHPEPTEVKDALAVVGVELPVESGPVPALIATLLTATGLVELR